MSNFIKGQEVIVKDFMFNGTRMDTYGAFQKPGKIGYWVIINTVHIEVPKDRVEDAVEFYRKKNNGEVV